MEQLLTTVDTIGVPENAQVKHSNELLSSKMPKGFEGKRVLKE